MKKIYDTEIQKPDFFFLKKTYFECVVDQTSNVFFSIHGAFSFHITSKQHWMRAGFPEEDK